MTGIYYEDLYPLLGHVPEFSTNADMFQNVDNLPLELSFHLSQHCAKLRKNDMIDIPQYSNTITALSGMVDCLSNLERIWKSPLPISYSIHLRQTVLLYLLTLPFQLIGPIGWVTIPVVFLASFTLLGIESIGTEIENPFGYDYNDLRMDVFCECIRKELDQMMSRSSRFDSTAWTKAVHIRKMNLLREPSMAQLK
jgi:putative membrane protein